MKVNLCLALATATVVAVPALAQTEWRPTNLNGADAEVRESSPDVNRGTSTELASRVKNAVTSGDPSDGNDRNSAIYTRFDLSYLAGVTTLPSDFTTAFRMTYRNNNMTGNRLQDTVTPNPALRTGLAIYGLKTTAAGANWDETTITYNNAPGITPDGDVGTKDFNSDLIFLGAVLFPEIGTQNHLPVGGELVFSSAKLDSFVSDAIVGGASSLTLVSTLIHGGDTPFTDWINFNYLFNPKEQLTLNADSNYDSNTMDPNNPVGPIYADPSNADGRYSPSLLLPTVVPEPTMMALAGFGAAALLVFRRRA